MSEQYLVELVRQNVVEIMRLHFLLSRRQQKKVVIKSYGLMLKSDSGLRKWEG